jgi:hypothetical protein
MEEYRVSEEYLNKIMEKWSRVLVGQVMKRFEILDDKQAIKVSVKELIYENTRVLKELIESFDSGIKFITKPQQTEKSV